MSKFQNAIFNEEAVDENAEEKAYDHYQGYLEISNETMSEFYDFGKYVYDDLNYEDAEAIMSFISFLNPFLFEPWLLIAIIKEWRGDYPGALYAATMASMSTFEQPEPHLIVASCHLAMKSEDCAKEALEMALDYFGGNIPDCYQEKIETMKKALGII